MLAPRGSPLAVGCECMDHTCRPRTPSVRRGGLKGAWSAGGVSCRPLIEVSLIHEPYHLPNDHDHAQETLLLLEPKASPCTAILHRYLYLCLWLLHCLHYLVRSH